MPQPKVEKLMLRAGEISETLGLSRSKVYQLIASGELPSVSIAGCIRVPVIEFKKWLEGAARAREMREGKDGNV